MRVAPFGRLLGSYTINDLGDSIGVVALAVLVFDRTESVAPTAGFFLVAKFFPALFATGLTAHLDRLPLRRTLPAIYALEAVVFGALALLADGDRFVLALVLVLGLIDGTLAITGRGLTRGAVGALLQPRELIAEGNALMNLGFAASSVFGAALAGGLIAAFGLSVALLVDAASFLVIAIVLAAIRAAGPRALRARVVAGSLPRRNRLRAREPGACGRCSPASRSRWSASRWSSRSRSSTRRRASAPRAPASACCCPPGAPASCSAACCSWGSSNRTGFGLILISSAAVGLAYVGMSQARDAAASRA